MWLVVAPTAASGADGDSPCAYRNFPEVLRTSKPSEPGAGSYSVQQPLPPPTKQSMDPSGGSGGNQTGQRYVTERWRSIELQITTCMSSRSYTQ